MSQVTTTRLHEDLGTVIVRKDYHADPEPQPTPLEKVELGCWFELSVDPNGGEYVRTLDVRNATPSIRELRAIADACNEIADAQEALNA